MDFYYTYDCVVNEELLQIINITMLTTTDHAVIAEKLNMTLDEAEKHILAAAALAAVKSGKAFKRTADKYTVSRDKITQITNNHPYLKAIASPTVKSNQELQQELQTLTARFDKLINDLNFIGLLEEDRIKADIERIKQDNKRLKEEYQQLLTQKARLTDTLNKFK